MLEKTVRFNRCLSCFQFLPNPGICPACGFDPARPGSDTDILPPGTILKGRYIAGKCLNSTHSQQISYLCWDLEAKTALELVEYFPRDLVTRDIRNSCIVHCRAGKEEQLELGRQDFFERAKLYYKCMHRFQETHMDFFFRNETCYYVYRLKNHP